jgi:hypothetical protein
VPENLYFHEKLSTNFGANELGANLIKFFPQWQSCMHAVMGMYFGMDFNR